MTTPQKVLHRVFREQRDRPFVWGDSDCLMWVADVAKELTGKDPAEHLRGAYSSALEARRIMERDYGGTMAGVAASMYQEIPVAQARVGDWVLVPNPSGDETLGVVAGSTVAARGEHGLVLAQLTSANRAFRVE